MNKIKLNLISSTLNKQKLQGCSQLTNTMLIFRRFFWGSTPHIYTLNKKLTNVAPNKAFNIISNIDNYQDYIPYCEKSFITQRDELNGLPIKAGLRIKFNEYDETFNCIVNCQELIKDQKFCIIAETIKNDLFNCLTCKWIITDDNNSSFNKRFNVVRKDPNISINTIPITNLQLIIKFQFKSTFYNLVSTIFGETLTNLAMKEFCKEISKR